MSLFRHIARISDDRKLKTVIMFRAMEGKNKRGRPHREWADEIEHWDEDTLQKLYHLAQDRDGESSTTLMVHDYDDDDDDDYKSLFQI